MGTGWHLPAKAAHAQHGWVPGAGPLGFLLSRGFWPLPHFLPTKTTWSQGLAGVRPQLAKHLSEPVICFMNNRKRFPACSLRSEENTELKGKNSMTVTPNTKETLSECFVTKAIRHLFISSSWQRCLSGRQQKTPLNKPSLGYLRLPPRRFCPQLFYLLLVRFFFSLIRLANDSL